MTDDKKQKPRLICYLETLAKEENRDRGALAALRGSLREGHGLDAARYVFPFLDNYSPYREREEDDALLVAGLFALHPESGDLSLAAALKRVERETGSDSVEARFRALLSVSRTELPTHLRNAVSLVASRNVPLDWADLYRTIRHWPGSSGRRRWAQDYWVASLDQDSPDTHSNHSL